MNRSPITQSLFHRRALALTLCLAGGLSAALLPATVHGQELADKPDRAYVTNGTVRALQQVGDTIYIGGNFTQVGPRTGPGVEVTLDGVFKRGPQIAGAGPAALPGSGGNVTAVAADGSGGWYVGGLFTHVGAAARTNLAHILANHHVDPNFKPTFDDAIRSIVVSGSTVYVGGPFTLVNGQPRNRIAALNIVDGSVTSFNPSPDNAVNALALSSDSFILYVGGSFTTIGGLPRKALAALNAADGSVLPFNALAVGNSGDPTVYALASSSSTLYVAGSFKKIGGQPRNSLAGLNLADATATAFQPKPSWFGCDTCAYIPTLAVLDSTVYVAGFFDMIGGQPRNDLAGLNAVDGSATAFNPNPDNTVSALAVSGSTIYAAGGFTSIGGAPRSGVAALNATDGTATSFSIPSPNSLVAALAVSPTGIYFGGYFSSLGGVARSSIAAISVTSGHVTDFDPNATFFGDAATISSLAISDSTLYVGGSFDTIGGQSRSYIAALNTADGQATSWNPGADGDVFTLAPSDGLLYAGGLFSNIGGQVRVGLAALSLVDGSATVFNPNPDGFVNALLVSGPLLYVGGRFTTIGGLQRNNIAAINFSDGTAAPFFDPDANIGGIVFAIAVIDKTVYIGGSFPTLHGVPRQNIGAVNAGDGMPTSFDPEATTAGVGYPIGGIVRALAASGSTVYAGGDFDMIGAEPRGLLAGLDAVTGAANRFNPNGPTNTFVSTLAVGPGGALYAGGLFNTFDLAFTQGYAAFSPRQLALPNILPAKQ